MFPSREMRPVALSCSQQEEQALSRTGGLPPWGKVAFTFRNAEDHQVCSLPIDILQSSLTWRRQSNIRHPPAKRTYGIIGHLDTQRTDTAMAYPHYIIFTVVLSGRFSVPLHPTKQALAISTECVYNARVFVVGHAWNHSRIYLFRKNMMRLGWGNFALKRPRGGQNRLPRRCERRF